MFSLISEKGIQIGNEMVLALFTDHLGLTFWYKTD